MKKKIIQIMGMGMFCMILVACSKNKDILVGYGKEDVNVLEKPVKFDKKQSTHLGEQVEERRPTDTGLDQVVTEWLIHKVNIFADPEAAAIDRREMTTVYDAYERSTGKPREMEIDNASMVVADMTIKNINNDMPLITYITLVYKHTDSNEVTSVGFPTYFSKSKSLDPEDTQYYHYELPLGASTEAKVAWLVDLEEYEKENLYLCIAFEGEEKYRRFVELGL